MEYQVQREANYVAFLWDRTFTKWRDVLEKLAKAFYEEDIKWALTCSSNLFFKGVVDDFHDLDILVEESAISKVKSVMNKLGAELQESPDIKECKSNVFLEYEIDGMDLDIISGFRILTFGTQYLYELETKDIEYISVDDLVIPLIPMEAQFLLYAMMEGWQRQRRYKRIVSQNFLIAEGLKHPEILMEALTSQLPAWIKDKTKKILVLTLEK